MDRYRLWEECGRQDCHGLSLCTTDGKAQVMAMDCKSGEHGFQVIPGISNYGHVISIFQVRDKDLRLKSLAVPTSFALFR